MSKEYYESYYKMGLFTKENLELFVSVGMLSAADEQAILATPQA